MFVSSPKATLGLLPLIVVQIHLPLGTVQVVVVILELSTPLIEAPLDTEAAKQLVNSSSKKTIEADRLSTRTTTKLTKQTGCQLE
jgi:hypothetical protein